MVRVMECGSLEGDAPIAPVHALQGLTCTDQLSIKARVRVLTLTLTLTITLTLTLTLPRAVTKWSVKL